MQNQANIAYRTLPTAPALQTDSGFRIPTRLGLWMLVETLGALAFLLAVWSLLL